MRIVLSLVVVALACIANAGLFFDDGPVENKAPPAKEKPVAASTKPSEKATESKGGLGGGLGGNEGNDGPAAVAISYDPPQHDDYEVVDQSRREADGAPTLSTLKGSLGRTVCAEGIAWINDNISFTLIMKDEVINIDLESGIDEAGEMRMMNDLNGRLLRFKGSLGYATNGPKVVDVRSTRHCYAIKPTDCVRLERLRYPGIWIPPAPCPSSLLETTSPKELVASIASSRSVERKGPSLSKKFWDPNNALERKELRFFGLDHSSLPDASREEENGLWGYSTIQNNVGRYIVAEGAVLMDLQLGPYLLMERSRLLINIRGGLRPECNGRLFQVAGKLDVNEAAGIKHVCYEKEIFSMSAV